MKGFIYMNKSTKNILPQTELMLCTLESVTSVTGVKRQSVSGEKTISNPTPNEYGTQSENTQFIYTLVKSNGLPITDDEQHIIEKWLTSSQYSQKLQLFEDRETNIICTYNGIFLETDWIPMCNGWVGVTFTFQSTTPYPYKHFSKQYTVRQSGTLEINCDTDSNEYIYPVLKIVEPVERASIKIQSITDNNNAITVNALKDLPITIDCQNCIVKDFTTDGLISFSDLGWSDIGNIYWLRLLPGRNQIKVTGNADITIDFDYVYKKVGGWY